ncbi:MAG: YlxR family protein [Oscillatoriophycideae cyanobacterium NC_groundwater_1537_Pr4_S-0.65um_50_18]|nr:YlxR family protein [Oscillatoriophycideae cyanobacterium NC_groundwater_1537_Pr4_S-0.65um_50_18]
MRPNQRRCVSCRKIAPKADFWRIVRVFPSRTVQLEKGMGRSVYLCPQHSCLQLAQKKDRLGRSLKAVVPPEIYQTLWQHLSASDRMIGSTMVESTATDSAITESAKPDSSP